MNITLFLENILLALLWSLATATFTVGNFLLGLLLGYVALWLTHRTSKQSSTYFARVPRVLSFVVFYVWELVKANLRVAYDVVTPTHYMRPGVVGIPLDARTDFEITTLANLITLTPGSVSLDVSSDRRTLYIHAMYIDENVDRLRQDIKENLERRVLEVLR